VSRAGRADCVGMADSSSAMADRSRVRVFGSRGEGTREKIGRTGEGLALKWGEMARRGKKMQRFTHC
jgi:hypothetical protein